MATRGVSVITCTNRPQYFNKILRNYRNQTWKKKELIIVLNRDDMKLGKYRRAVEGEHNIRVLRQPQHLNLGACLNYAIRRAKYGVIAKFDDDDYYAPHYVTRALNVLQRSKADIVGKKTFYLYLQSKNMLLQMNPNREHRFYHHVAGATLFFYKRILKRVPFATKLKSGSDSNFLRRCRAKGYKIYSGDRYNYVAIRRQNRTNHTWKVEDNKLLSGNVRIIARTKIYRKKVRR
ncbi:glycosyltransferase [Paenibacillus rigui]|uniref:Glycosyl transferase family 2 n=1 Tax=Paenibacillus rigui TaxID=554312 RepID=A0A229ULL5_9BACL|nr:glycosyltransferase family A protein [Paenibacillus rigui]OXM84348.1 glycosyl transferase family 2 [Paenibacillus rigui]